MPATRDPSMARNRVRSPLLIAAIALLTVPSWSPSHAEERHGSCEQQGEILAIYDCQTGLVLWSRGPSKTPPPRLLSDRELCQLVVGSEQSPESAGRCL